MFKKSFYFGFCKIVILGFLISSCQEAFIPDDIDSSKNLLVVSGGVTDQPGPYQIRLQWASSFTKPVINPILKATVTISDDNGFSEKLIDIKNGYYRTVDLQGVRGRSYKISIVLPDRSRYESDYELLPFPVKIDSIYAEIGDKDFVSLDYEGDINVTNYKGLQIYADVVLPQSNQAYMLFSNEVVTERTFITGIGKSPSPPTVYVWTVRRPDEYPLIKASINYNGGQLIKKYPLAFLSYIPDLSNGTDSTTPYTNMGWVINTSSQQISYSAYLYYENINRQLKADLRLFDPIVSQIKGNIHCITDSTRPALGYFETTSLGNNSKYFYWAPNNDKIITRDIKVPGPSIDSVSIGAPFDFWVRPY